MIILDGKQIAKDIRIELRAQVEELKRQGRRVPRLAVIIVGHNPASETYVANKVKACTEVGFDSVRIALDETITEQELLEQVRDLNEDPEMDGYIVQLPLPKHINEQVISNAIDYRKDVDGFTPENVGRTMLGLDSIMSATPFGISELLMRYNIATKGKHIVIIGRSNIVGKPMASIFIQKGERGDATVTICHSRTKNLKEICLSADILVAAIGVPKFVTADMVKEGATVIDVGINRVDDASSPKGFKLVGDVDFENVAPKCEYITPVPGGVGPMTIASLLQNTMKAYMNNAR